MNNRTFKINNASMNKITWLELGSNGYYYMVVPSRLESKGLFPFKLNDAIKELQRTIEYLKGKVVRA